MTRSNLDHSHCTHPRTPAGRQACRKARAKMDPVTERVAQREAELDDAFEAEEEWVRITRKDAKAYRGHQVCIKTNDQVFSGMLLQWGPQALVIVPDEDTKAMLNRNWKRESFPTAAIKEVLGSIHLA